MLVHFLWSPSSANSHSTRFTFHLDKFDFDEQPGQRTKLYLQARWQFEGYDPFPDRPSEFMGKIAFGHVLQNLSRSLGLFIIVNR